MDAAVRGRVIDARGDPVAGARLELESLEPDSLEPHSLESGGLGSRLGFQASSDGSFLLRRLAPGAYVVRAATQFSGAKSATASSTLHLESDRLAEVVLILREPALPSPFLQSSFLRSSFLRSSFLQSSFLRVPFLRVQAWSELAPQSAGQTAPASGSQTGSQMGAQSPNGSPANSVAATSPLLAPDFGLTVTDTDLDQLPVASREWEDLAELDSAANSVASAERSPGSGGEDDAEGAGGSDTASAGSPAAGLSYTGLSPTQNAQSLDGLSANQSFRSGPRGAASGGPSARASFGQGAVQSFHTMLSNFSARRGGGAGGLVSVLSRSGGDRLHGSLFLLERSSVLAATNPYSIATNYNNGVVTSSPVKPAGSQEEFGGSVGLPLNAGFLPARVRHRASIFGSLELQVHDDHIVCTPQLANFFSLTAGQTALLGTRGVGGAATNAALNYLNSLTGTVARSAWRSLGFVRLDASPTARDSLSLTYSGNRFDAPSGAALGQASDAVVARGTGSLGDSHVNVDAAAAHWRHIFSPHFSSDLSGQFSHDLDYDTAHAPLPQEPGIGPGGFAPQVSIAPNGFAYGTPANLGRSAYPDEQRIELADAMHLARGRHLFTLGGDWSRIHDRIASLYAPDGAFSYDSSAVNGHDGGLVDWITDYTFNVHAYPNGGCPSIVAPVHYFCFRSFTQSFGAVQTEFVTHDIAGYFEDAMRLHANLTLTLGVRYDYTLLPVPQIPNPLLDAEIAGLPNYAASGSLQGASRIFPGSTSSFPEDRNNFGPRFAVAWSPRLRHKSLFTAHLGYGLFYGQIPGATIRAALTDTGLFSRAAFPGENPNLPAADTHIRIRPTTVTVCPQITNVQQGFGYPCAYTSAPPASVAQTTSATFFASRYRAPAVQRAALVVERDFGRSLLVRASYAMATATQLPNSVDVNITPDANVGTFVLQGGDGHPGLHSGETFVVPVYTARPILGYGALTALVSNANATYHAATVEAVLHGPPRFQSLELRGSYTFSRAIDYAPLNSALPGLNHQFDPFHIGYDKGLSNQNFPQRFSGDLMVTTHLGEGPKPLRRALSGWRASAIGTAGSGAPYSYGVFALSYLSGGRASLNGSGGARYLPTVGRNTLRLAPRGKVDLRLSREFALRLGPSIRPSGSDRLHLNFFAQAFNLLNAQNIARVETRAYVIGTSTATTPSGTPLPNAPIPLIFQDAAAVASEGLTTLPFGAPTSSTSGTSRERQVEFGFRAQF